MRQSGERWAEYLSQLKAGGVELTYHQHGALQKAFAAGMVSMLGDLVTHIQHQQGITPGELLAIKNELFKYAERCSYDLGPSETNHRSN